MIVLDLRPFDTVEDVSFNELFTLVPNPFPNPNSFENFEIFGYPSRFDVSGSRTSLISTNRDEASNTNQKETEFERNSFPPTLERIKISIVKNISSVTRKFHGSVRERGVYP